MAVPRSTQPSIPTGSVNEEAAFAGKAKVWFCEMEVSVDRRQLLADKDVPVGLARCLYDTLVDCSCHSVHHPPLNTCCAQSIIGSWSSKLLWLPLGRRGAGEGSPGRWVTWMTFLSWVGCLLLAAVVPLPYYIRLTVFYVFEDEEMRDRRKAVDTLGLRYGFDHDLFQWLTPTHGVVVAVYLCYAVSVVSLLVLRRTRDGVVDRLITQTVSDLRRLRPSACVRLLVAHFLLPLEKFGLLCGVVVGLVYWPLTLPLCLLAVCCYTVPLIYVTGRLIIHARCRCLSSLPLTSNHAQSGDLSEGVTSFEQCCFLDAISSSDKGRVGMKEGSSGCVGVSSSLKRLVVGMLVVVLVWSLLLVYAEATGFAVEMLVMTSVGFVLNSGSDAARRVVLMLWGLVYVVACYRAAVGKYVQFSRAVFAAMKRRLADRLLAVAALRSGRNTAFKYLTADEIQRLTETIQGDNISAVASTPLLPAMVEDSIEYQSNLLHWKISALSLFVDHQDSVHIPRDLFYRLCRLDVPGSPRSGLRVILTALGRLVIGGLFLLVFGLVLELSADAQTSDGGIGTGQTLVTVAFGALPLIIYTMLTRLTATRRCGSELFDGKVEREVLSYVQSWPVFDLTFRQTGNTESVTSRPEVADDATELKAVSSHDNQLVPNASRDNASSRDTTDSHVDLLITIRDDDDDEDASGNTAVKPRSGGLATTDRGSPVGSGTPRLDREAPPDELATAPATPAGIVRPRSVIVDEENRATTQSGSAKKDRIGFLLRKQNSTSTIPLRSQMKEEEVSRGRTSSTLVVDMSGDGDVTAVTTSTAAVGSTRSLPSHDVPESHCESTL